MAVAAPSPASPPRRPYVGQALALTIGLGGGAIAAAAGLPLPWMLGSMIAVTIAALVRLPVRGPNALRPSVVPIIGVMLGSALSPDTLEAAGRWIGTIAILPVFLAVAAVLAYAYYRRIGRYDPVTAYFCAMPGGLNEMLIMGTAAGGEERRIALAHASRVLVVIAIVALFYGTVLGVRGQRTGAAWTALSDPSLTDWVVLGGCAIIGGLLGRVVRVAAAPILFPMILSGAAHIAELVTIAPPTLVVNGAQLTIGTIIGCRFVGAAAREVGRDLTLAAGSSVLMIGAAILGAWAVHALTETPLSQSFLAFSPGGLAEMGLLAFAMGQDVAYVSVMHLARILVVVFFAKPIFDVLRR